MVDLVLGLELASFLAAVVALALRPTGRRAAVALVLGSLLVASATWGRERRLEAETTSREALAAALPQAGQETGYVSSDTCRACHPGEYQSWHRTFHRTMTQAATPAAVRGRFEGVKLERAGWTYHLERRGEEFWVEMVDPDWERVNRMRGAVPETSPNPPRVERRVVMTTGSHHMQTYWLESRFGNELVNFPFVYLFEAERWVPREDVFLRPPQADRFTDLWNDNCIECHSTRGVPGLTEKSEAFSTRAAELGIACEACHGPAAEHVAKNRNPLRRYGLRLAGEGDPTIVLPARLDSRRASETCGQCHGVWLSDARDWLASGHGFKPGEELEASRFPVLPAKNGNHARLKRLVEQEPQALDARFWLDGQVRVSGREFTAMAESPCFERGELSCLSCHSMHSAPPADQLSPGMEGDAACLQCHGAFAAKLEAHTHHAAASEGSHCMNCHMPHTTYGLLTAMRSHTVDSPNLAATLATGRPNACNQCHLDQTLAWTAEHLAAWYGQPSPELSPAEANVAAIPHAALTGDAGQRALAAWAMGWQPALEAAGTGWQGPFLAHLLNDPYAAVRYVAQRSLRRQSGFESLRYDFVGDPRHRAEARGAALDRWRTTPWQPTRFRGPQTLISPEGKLATEALATLAAQRNDRPIALGE